MAALVVLGGRSTGPPAPGQHRGYSGRPTEDEEHRRHSPHHDDHLDGTAVDHPTSSAADHPAARDHHHGPADHDHGPSDDNLTPDYGYPATYRTSGPGPRCCSGVELHPPDQRRQLL
jgi:hypothetical protein